jgi:hypothetical protein
MKGIFVRPTDPGKDYIAINQNGMVVDIKACWLRNINEYILTWEKEGFTVMRVDMEFSTHWFNKKIPESEIAKLVLRKITRE